ncbi:MAG TPA: hypothetical protein VM118_14425, partial [Acidobacteriota bacterium]|nr:hypothetical protein [Acidobacteriota bacterium]
MPERVTRADSLAQLFFGGIIPDWAVHQDQPTTGSRDEADFLATGFSIDCPPSFEMDLASEADAVRFDSVRNVWELYDADPDNSCINRYDFAADLSYSTTIIPIASAAPCLAEDLDQDGGVEIVSQYGDHLLIHSSPDGALLADYEWSGFNVVMYPAAANIDDDRFIEIFVTPHTLGGTARAVIIKYDSLAGSFVKLADIAVPTNAAGPPAVGDFDEDGRF